MRGIALGTIERNFSSDQTEEMLQALVENDQQTYVNLEYSRKLFDKIVESGGTFDHSKLNSFLQLRDRYKERQTALKESKAIRTQSWVDDKIKAFKNWLGLSGLGAIPAIPVAIGAVVGVVATLAIYFAFRPRYSESTRDLRISSELKTVLDQLNPEVAERITQDLENQIDKAFIVGKREGAFGSLLSIGKVALIAGLGIWGFLEFFPKISSAVSNTKSKLVEQ